MPAPRPDSFRIFFGALVLLTARARRWWFDVQDRRGEVLMSFSWLAGLAGPRKGTVRLQRRVRLVPYQEQWSVLPRRRKRRVRRPTTAAVSRALTARMAAADCERLPGEPEGRWCERVAGILAGVQGALLCSRDRTRRRGAMTIHEVTYWTDVPPHLARSAGVAEPVRLVLEIPTPPHAERFHQRLAQALEELPHGTFIRRAGRKRTYLMRDLAVMARKKLNVLLFPPNQPRRYQVDLRGWTGGDDTVCLRSLVRRFFRRLGHADADGASITLAEDSVAEAVMSVWATEEELIRQAKRRLWSRLRDARSPRALKSIDGELPALLVEAYFEEQGLTLEQAALGDQAEVPAALTEHMWLRLIGRGDAAHPTDTLGRLAHKAVEVAREEVSELLEQEIVALGLTGSAAAGFATRWLAANAAHVRGLLNSSFLRLLLIHQLRQVLGAGGPNKGGAR